MDLKIRDRLFIVTGATSGLGRGVADALLSEGARLVAVARRQDGLDGLSGAFPGQVEGVAGDITLAETQRDVMAAIGSRELSGVCINAGGPPAKAFLETEPDDWDQAYRQILRWKVAFTMLLIPLFRSQGYGRLLYIESESVKQPVENLVLSNSLRLAVVGFVKTLSQEVAAEGITLNVLAPGFHDTAAARRLFVKRSEVEHIPVDEARKKYEQQIKVGRLGDPAEFGLLAAWLMSPHSGYITGQTITMDGGSVRGTMG